MMSVPSPTTQPNVSLRLSQCLPRILFVRWYPPRLLTWMTLLATADRKKELYEGEETNENLH